MYLLIIANVYINIANVYVYINSREYIYDFFIFNLRKLKF